MLKNFTDPFYDTLSDTGSLTSFVEIKPTGRNCLMREKLVYAKSSQKLKAAFISKISHDFRTSLNAVQGFAQILSMCEGSADERKEYAEIVSAEVEKLILLFDRVIDRLNEMPDGLLEDKDL